MIPPEPECLPLENVAEKEFAGVIFVFKKHWNLVERAR